MNINRTFIFPLISLSILGCASTPSNVNDINVAHNACYSYIYGQNGFELDYDKALDWCTKATNLGASSSQTLLAELYLEGHGVDKDLIKAAKLYELAAQQGHPHAQLMVFMVHNIYRQGESSPEDKDKGVMFLERAKDAKYPKAVKIYNDIYGQKI